MNSAMGVRIHAQSWAVATAHDSQHNVIVALGCDDLCFHDRHRRRYVHWAPNVTTTTNINNNYRIEKKNRVGL
jgi:hypothetical protein